ncbi:MAG: hypothetical protein HQL30_11195 [Candidatus Omnitrophica bacterium]|nr:hypothetical protein [Candidatus Omnitrophota bacterium]
MKKEIKSSTKGKVSFVHEISQPITAILTYAAVARRKLAGREPKVWEILGHIIEDCHRANELILKERELKKKGD